MTGAVPVSIAEGTGDDKVLNRDWIIFARQDAIQGGGGRSVGQQPAGNIHQEIEVKVPVFENIGSPIVPPPLNAIE